MRAEDRLHDFQMPLKVGYLWCLGNGLRDKIDRQKRDVNEKTPIHPMPPRGLTSFWCPVSEIWRLPTAVFSRLARLRQPNLALRNVVIELVEMPAFRYAFGTHRQPFADPSTSSGSDSRQGSIMLVTRVPGTEPVETDCRSKLDETNSLTEFRRSLSRTETYANFPWTAIQMQGGSALVCSTRCLLRAGMRRWSPGRRFRVGPSS